MSNDNVVGVPIDDDDLEDADADAVERT